MNIFWLAVIMKMMDVHIHCWEILDLLTSQKVLTSLAVLLFQSGCLPLSSHTSPVAHLLSVSVCLSLIIASLFWSVCLTRCLDRSSSLYLYVSIRLCPFVFSHLPAYSLILSWSVCLFSLHVIHLRNQTMEFLRKSIWFINVQISSYSSSSSSSVTHVWSPPFPFFCFFLFFLATFSSSDCDRV